MTNHTHREVSRRDFLKTGGAGLAAAVISSQLVGISTVSASAPQSDHAYGILIDVTRCVGCNACARACRESNNLPECAENPEHLDCNSLSIVNCFENSQFIGKDSNCSETISIKRQCMHCLHPACVSACTVGALYKTPEGPVLYDADRCIGCRYCQYACPFGVPTYEWCNPTGLIHKCQLCVERLGQGLQPACVAACPTGALIFGERQKLLRRAHVLLEEYPDRYVDHVYGEFEVGGTSVLYISPVPFEELGLPTFGPEPIPHYAETVMENTPVIAVSVAAVASGLHWITKRRELNMQPPIEQTSVEEEIK